MAFPNPVVVVTSVLFARESHLACFGRIIVFFEKCNE